MKLPGVLDVFVEQSIVVQLRPPGLLSEDSVRSALKAEGVALSAFRREAS